MSDDHLIEHRVQREELLRGHFLHVLRDTVQLPNQNLATREYVVHPGAVMVIPMLDTPDGLRLVMERQFRYPVGQVMTEFPAGKLDPGEDPWLCAQRELLEETGYTARQWARAGVLHPVIGYSTEVIEIWFAKELTLGERQLDTDEFLDVFTATPAELMAACQQGLLTDAKTLTGLLWLQNVQSGLWPLQWQTPA
ncbi:NUDIX domain-containing protein [Limnohabitans sp. Rim28]|uniref:NUDIX domain-containing protein n=1 Tax=Limnohabitans sp. Rim28 TaxID=1100720 RepID=UPI0002E014DB|nr:NUDIX hydrolase [Limnohabitans sp. Rim28]PVE09618.1 NUDIX domain-containing protein [Limnohabitans sp. Rim28]